MRGNASLVPKMKWFSSQVRVSRVWILDFRRDLQSEKNIKYWYVEINHKKNTKYVHMNWGPHSCDYCVLFVVDFGSDN